jgi:hypothetical protein
MVEPSHHRIQTAPRISAAPEKDVYAPSLRESGLHRCCNRIARNDVEQKYLDSMDISGQSRIPRGRRRLLVDVIEFRLPIC